MHRKPLDKTKKANIKCEHCEYWDRGKLSFNYNEICKLTLQPKSYYQRCQKFKWIGEE